MAVLGSLFLFIFRSLLTWEKQQPHVQAPNTKRNNSIEPPAVPLFAWITACLTSRRDVKALKPDRPYVTL